MIRHQLLPISALLVVAFAATISATESRDIFRIMGGIYKERGELFRDTGYSDSANSSRTWGVLSFQMMYPLNRPGTTNATKAAESGT